MNCYLFSCFFFSHLPTVTFFPVTFYPTCPLLLSFLLLFFLLLFFLPETVTFFPVTFFPVTFFLCTIPPHPTDGDLETRMCGLADCCKPLCSVSCQLLTQAGAPLHSHWLATRHVRAPPEVHPLKMFEILGHPHFQHLHGHKIPMNATNSPDRLNLYIFSLSLSYHSFVSVQDIQHKRLLNKTSVYAFTHPGGQHRVANATLFVACTRGGCATFRSPVTSSEVTWSPLWRSTHLPNSEIFNARNNAFFIATAHVVKDAVAKVLSVDENFHHLSDICLMGFIYSI